MALATPAVVRGSLILRTQSKAAELGLSDRIALLGPLAQSVRKLGAGRGQRCRHEESGRERRSDLHRLAASLLTR